MQTKAGTNGQTGKTVYRHKRTDTDANILSGLGLIKSYALAYLHINLLRPYSYGWFTSLLLSLLVHNSRKMTQDDTVPTQPGSCALRLAQLNRHSSRTKKALIQSLATDISSAFILIAQQSEAGHLRRKHTGPINDVVSLIKDTENSQREMLEDAVRKYKRRTRRSRREKEWMQREFRGVVKTLKSVNKMLGVWRERVKRVEAVAEELGAVRRECEMLRTGRGAVIVNGVNEEKDDAAGGEIVRIASPMEVDGHERTDWVDVRNDGSGP